VIILEIERFTSNQIIVHFIAALSLLVLFITGIPQLYPEHLGWILDLVGLSKAMFIHRLAGFGLVSVAVYFLIYSIFSAIWKNHITVLRSVSIPELGLNSDQ